jgi:2-desacetyl-2-hydroxyethyl bacteriochlorophyllide A dehydrogenase
VRAKAVVFIAPRTVEVQHVETPEPGPGDAVIRVTHSWISNGTEGSFLRGERTAGDTPYRVGNPWPFPIVAGYQKVGVVEHVGEDIDDLSVGETVFCVQGQVQGMYQSGGGHISPSVTARSGIYKLPEKLDPLAASGLVLTQVGYNCGARPHVNQGDSAVVIGDGLVGQWAAQALRFRGARVALLGRHEDRMSRFEPDGDARFTLDAGDPEWVGNVCRLFPKGLDVLVDTVGSLGSVEDLLPLMVRFGHFVSAGFYGTQDRFALQPARDFELTVHLVSGLVRDRMERTLKLIAAGHLLTLPLITHHFPVDSAADAWRLIESKSEPVMGVILDW